MRISLSPALLAVVIAVSALSQSCSTAPKAADQSSFLDEAKAAKRWFEAHVPGLDKQIAGSAGYVVYPSVGQWGIIFMGGQFGRGMVCDNKGKHIGWGAVNIASIGLQAGVRGFKMLVVIEDKDTLQKFKDNRLSGSVTGVAVAAETGTSATGPFTNGIVAYQGASTGLMAGVNIGLDYLRFKPLGDDE